MQTKKITVLMAFMPILFYTVHFASAQGYSPLVRIPGLPTSGTVNLSMYLIGMYNFLLSVVGIVAVMMLIVGGMRYITSAGNQAAASDAKDIINNAIIGLILALFSWVFIATINPDVLYIKQPANQNLATYNPKCTISAFDADPCLCTNGETVPLDAGSTCDETCKNGGNCIPLKLISCIANGADNVGDVTGRGCLCADGTAIVRGKKKEASLVLTVDAAAPAVGGMITLTATLTDSGSGAPLGGKEIIFNAINSSLNVSDSSLSEMANSIPPMPTITNGAGVSTFFFSVNCAAVDEWQAVFASEATDAYTPVGSNIITVSSVGVPACGLVDYDIKPAAKFWEAENLHTCNNYCMDNCGYGYLRIKVAPEDGVFKDDKSLGYNYFVMGDTSKLFEFTRISDGTFSSFDIEKRFLVWGGETYSCAILITLENVAPDSHRIYWVKEGATIKKDGASLREDIENSGIPNPSWHDCCGGWPTISSCRRDAWSFCTSNMCGAESAVPGTPWLCAFTDDGDRLWSAQYRTGLAVGSCEDCSRLQGENGTIYRPARDITCKRDFLGRGVWE